MNFPIPSPLPVPIQTVLMMIAFAAALYDLRTRRIPNWITVTGFILGLATNTLLEGTSGLVRALLGFVLGFGIYLGLYLLHAMGAGDVKLMGAMGAIAGWRHWLLILLMTSLASGILALALAIRKGRLRSTLWNVAYLARELASFHAPWLTHEQLDVKNPETLRLPHAVSIGLGILAVILFQWFE